MSVLLTTFVLRWWPGDRFLPVRLFNYAMPWFLVVLIPSFAVAAILGRRWLAISLIVPAIYIIFLYAPLFISHNQQVKKDGFTFKVMSFNAWSRNRDLNSTAKVIMKASPDILLLQELHRRDIDKLLDLLDDLFPANQRSIEYDPRSYLTTISCYPITSIPLTIKAPVQKSVVTTPEGPVTVYNAHFLRTFMRYRYSWQRLHDQLDNLLVNEIAQQDGPVILGGDFNVTDQTESYRMVRRYLKNAHWEVGRGFGFTFPSPGHKKFGPLPLPALARIDHLFYNNGLIAVMAGTLPESGGSDHLPIVAEFTVSTH